MNEQEKGLAHTANEDYHFIDPWEEAIAKYVIIHQKVTTQEIMTSVLKLDLSQNDQQKQRRVINILQRLGCESKTISRNGRKFRAWVYTPLPEGNISVTHQVTPDVTAEVTAQTQSQQAIETTVQPVTLKLENFVKSDEIEANSKPITVDVTDVTAVTAVSDNSQNLCADDVTSCKVILKAQEETAVLPSVAELPESEWMSEESLSAISRRLDASRIATDLEACEDFEMIQIVRTLYDKEALKAAARRISAHKREQIRQWVALLDAEEALNHPTSQKSLGGS